MKALAEWLGLRCLNVKQPWASLLVHNLKNVENRGGRSNRPSFGMPSPLDNEEERGEWVLIIASKLSSPPSNPRPDRQEIADALTDFQRVYGDEEGSRRHAAFMAYFDRVGWPSQAAVGFVCFDRLLTTTEADGWYRGGTAGQPIPKPNVGWGVRAGSAIALPRPITGLGGVLSIANIETSPSMQSWKERALGELKRQRDEDE